MPHMPSIIRKQPVKRFPIPNDIVVRIEEVRAMVEELGVLQLALEGKKPKSRPHGYDAIREAIVWYNAHLRRVMRKLGLDPEKVIERRYDRSQLGHRYRTTPPEEHTPPTPVYDLDMRPSARRIRL